MDEAELVHIIPSDASRQVDFYFLQLVSVQTPSPSPLLWRVLYFIFLYISSTFFPRQRHICRIVGFVEVKCWGDNTVIVMARSERWERGTPFLSLIQDTRGKGRVMSASRLPPSYPTPTPPLYQNTMRWMRQTGEEARLIFNPGCFIPQTQTGQNVTKRFKINRIDVASIK